MSAAKRVATRKRQSAHLKRRTTPSRSATCVGEVNARSTIGLYEGPQHRERMARRATRSIFANPTRLAKGGRVLSCYIPDP